MPILIDNESAAIMSVVGTSVIGVVGFLVKNYDRKIREERLSDLKDIKQDINDRFNKHHEELSLATAKNNNIIDLNTQAMNHLSDAIANLNNSIEVIREDLVDIKIEQRAVKESTKSAHKRITELAQRGLCDKC